MRVLFINKFLNKHTIYRVPLGILYLSALVKNKHKVAICEPSRADPFDVVREFKPDVIAYSIRTGFHQYYLNLNKKLKEKFNFFSVFGGPHATFYPDMIDAEGVDCVMIGESEYAFRELLDNLNDKKTAKKTKNCWIRVNNKIYKNPLMPLEQNLDRLPFPDRDLLINFPEIKNAKIQNFITSRGCPYNCTYCFNHQLKQLYNKQIYVRRRSVDNVIKEVIETQNKFKFTLAHFEDDTFNLDRGWLQEFAEKYPRIPFKCNIRPNLVDEEVIQLLKKANCISVTFGIEAGNDRIRNEIYKRGINKKDITKCAKLLKKYKIRFITENILGSPTSTLADDIETLDLNMACHPDYPTVSLMQPYPKTEIYEIARSNNQLPQEDPHFDNLGSFFEGSVLDIPDKEKRLNLQKLFALVVAFPFLRKHINFLISRKRTASLYSLFYNAWRVYCLLFRIMPHKMNIKEVYWLARRYVTR